MISVASGEYFPSFKLPLRILAGVWCLVMLVVINGYTGNLISYLTVPKLKPIVNSFQDLAESDTLKIAVEAKTVLAETFLVSRLNLFVRKYVHV